MHGQAGNSAKAPSFGMHDLSRCFAVVEGL